MAFSAHFAVLVTINRYPGLSDLEGPEQDGNAFRAWLESTTGGNLDPLNIVHIKSSTFGVMTSPYDANPTERQLIQQLDQWLRVPGSWKERVGERLYMYFAGHGFTAGSAISDPALLSAVAQNGDPAHIAGCRYAAKIANAGFFDEIVLVMDCCQDVLKSSQVLEPTWSPPDRNKSTNVRVLQAFGAPRGRKAFERSLTKGALPRGLFSSVWIEALETAACDEDGWVTGHAVKMRVQQLWSIRFKQETGYDPPVRTPDGEDIRLFRRSPTVPSGATPHVSSKEPHDVSPTHPLPSGHAGSDASHVRKPADIEFLASEEALALSRGTTITLTAPDYGTEISVFDASSKKLNSSFGKLVVALPPGDYSAQFETADAIRDKVFKVNDQPLSLGAPEIKFTSAAPVLGTRGVRPHQSFIAEILASGSVNRILGSSEAQLLIVVREPEVSVDTSTELSAATELTTSAELSTLWEELRLESLEDDTIDELLDLSASSCSFLRPLRGSKLGLPEGTYALVQADEFGSSGSETSHLRFAVQTVRGWRTEVYIDCLPQSQNGNMPSRSRLDLSSASVHLVPMNSRSLLHQRVGRETEIARVRLSTGRRVALPVGEQGGKSPMLTLFAAYSALGNGENAVKDVRNCLNDAPKELLTTIPDFLLLERWCRLQEGEQLVPLQPLLGVPMLAQGWQLSAKLPAQAGLHDEFGMAVGQWRVGGGFWTCWRQSPAIAKENLESLRREWSLELRYRAHSSVSGKEQQSSVGISLFQRRKVRLHPPLTVESWAPVAKGLRDPDPTHSPFQQALRRRILDGLEGEELGAINIFRDGAQFGLPRVAIARAYEALFRAAKKKAE